MSFSERLWDHEAAPWVNKVMNTIKAKNTRLKIAYPTKLGARRALNHMIGNCQDCQKCVRVRIPYKGTFLND